MDLLTWFDWLSLALTYALRPVVMFTERRRIAIGSLAVLVLDVLEPIAEILWPN